MRQLVGQVADHVDRTSWSATLSPSAELQGLDLRDIDPTDIRQFLPALIGDAAWLTPEPYVFRGRDKLRGREWERDYSHLGQSETLLMPSTALVRAGDLRWDRRGGWQATDGRVQVQDP